MEGKETHRLVKRKSHKRSTAPFPSSTSLGLWPTASQQIEDLDLLTKDFLEATDLRSPLVYTPRTQEIARS